MNKDRRTRLEEIREKISAIICDLEEIRDEEESALTNLPESLQESSRGQEMQEAVDCLGDIYDNLEHIPQQLEDLINGGN